MQVNVKKLTETAIIPTQGSKGAAGYDLYADALIKDKGRHRPHAINLGPHLEETIGTGIAMEIPEGYVGLVFARSGLGIKKGVVPRNCVGVIDSDYRGEIMVCLVNNSADWVKIDIDDRIAQIVIVPYATLKLNVVDELTDTVRGEGGFGSTGKD